MSPALARALVAALALLEALEQRLGTDALLPTDVVEEARAAYAALSPADRAELAAALRTAREPTEN